MNRRRFLRVSVRTLAAASLALPAWRGSSMRAGAAAGARRPELRINRILIQVARGRRQTPVAPNAYAPYRGFDVRDPVLRLQTAQGLEGIAHYTLQPEVLKPLLGHDPFALFDWDGDRIRGAAPEHGQLFETLAGADIALLDLLGRVMQRPVADLLGRRVREEVPVYDSSLYMEDLLKPAERGELAYIKGPAPSDPAEMVARKALWVLEQPAGVRILKLKIGRAKWMGSFDEGRDRDIAVFRAVRRAVGRKIRLLVDGNDGYKPRPPAAAEFAEAVADLDLYALEEMFPEDRLAETRALKRRLRAAGMKSKLADGEGHLGGIRELHRTERFAGPHGEEPLFDIDQADMNRNGFLRLQRDAADCLRRGMTLAPHNFGSKLGLYAMVHLGLVTPNFEFCESDDTQILGLVPSGLEFRQGVARLTGEPGLGVTLREANLDKPSMALEI